MICTVCKKEREELHFQKGSNQCEYCMEAKKHGLLMFTRGFVVGALFVAIVVLFV